MVNLDVTCPLFYHLTFRHPTHLFQWFEFYPFFLVVHSMHLFVYPETLTGDKNEINDNFNVGIAFPG